MPSLKKKISKNKVKSKNNIRKSKKNIRKSKKNNEKRKNNKTFKGGSNNNVLPYDSFLDRLDYLKLLYTNLLQGGTLSKAQIKEIQTLCEFNHLYSGHFDESCIQSKVLETKKGPLNEQQLIQAQQEKIGMINFRNELISNICSIFSQREMHTQMQIAEDKRSKLPHVTQFQQRVNCSQPPGFPQENCELCLNPYQHIPEYNSFRCVNPQCQMDHESLNRVRNQILNFSPHQLVCQNSGCGALGLSLWPYSKSVYSMPLAQCMACGDRSSTLTGATTPRGTPVLVRRPDK